MRLLPVLFLLALVFSAPSFSQEPPEQAEGTEVEDFIFLSAISDDYGDCVCQCTVEGKTYSSAKKRCKTGKCGTCDCRNPKSPKLGPCLKDSSQESTASSSASRCDSVATSAES